MSAAAAAQAQPASPSARPALSVGRTWHRRLRPVDHSFAYPVLFLWLPMRQWRADAQAGLRHGPARNRFGLLSFHDRDHGLGGPDALAWVESLLREQGIEADGEIWLQTLPRVLGHAFKPVSFWHVQDAQGRPAAVLAEVNNTFGERHCYLLRAPAPDTAPGQSAAAATGPGVLPATRYRLRAQARKVFHVSPFCERAGRYEFEFDALGDWRSARVNLVDEQGPLLRTSLVGRLQPYHPSSAWRVLATMPWTALAVLWRIHWQALRLWRQGVPFWRKPPAPANFVSD